MHRDSQIMIVYEFPHIIRFIRVDSVSDQNASAHRSRATANCVTCFEMACNRETKNTQSTHTQSNTHTHTNSFSHTHELASSSCNRPDAQTTRNKDRVIKHFIVFWLCYFLSGLQYKANTDAHVTEDCSYRVCQSRTPSAH